MELSEQFQYGPAFKNKENSQGTLFRPARKGALQSPEARQPRGFSPERRRQVERGIGAINAGKSKRTRADLINTIARSTIPAEHFKGLTEVTGNADIGPLGTYSMGRVKVAPGEERTVTPIHEIGHHADLYHGERDRSRFAGQGAAKNGAEEGFAENYAEEHARQPGYKRKRETISEEGKNPAFSWMGGGPSHQMSDFNTAYYRERTKDYTLNRDQFGNQFNRTDASRDRDDKEALMYKYENGAFPAYTIPRRFGPQYGA